MQDNPLHFQNQYPQSFQDNGQFSQYQEPPFYPEENGCYPEPASFDDGKKGKERPIWFMQLKSHGGKAAVQFETSETIGNWHTINIECAQKDPKDPNGKRFDWTKKMVLQLTRNELPVVAAVLLGMLPAVRFDNHGEQGKWIEIMDQGKNFYFRLGGINLPQFAIPVPIAEAYMFGTLALSQYTRNFHGMSNEAALTIIRSMANQLYASNTLKQPHTRG